MCRYFCPCFSNVFSIIVRICAHDLTCLSCFKSPLHMFDSLLQILAHCDFILVEICLAFVVHPCSPRLNRLSCGPPGRQQVVANWAAVASVWEPRNDTETMGLDTYFSSHLSIHPSIHLSTVSIHLSIHLSIYPSIYPSTYLSIYLHDLETTMGQLANRLMATCWLNSSDLTSAKNGRV